MAAGVIKELGPDDRKYYTYEDVMVLLGVKRAKAYRMISQMQKQLKAEGKMFSDFPEGKIPKKIFNKLCMLD